MIRDRASLARSPRHAAALAAVEAGIEAAHPHAVIPATVRRSGDHLVLAGETVDLSAVDDLIVIGAGKPVAAAASALETVLGDRIDGGHVVTDRDVSLAHVEVTVGTHPLPEPANLEGTRRVLELAAAADGDDLVIVLVGGGGSALLCSPAEPIGLETYRAVVRTLLRSGADITEVNAVRTCLSTVKGGRLARTLAPAPSVALVFSDVVGDPLPVVASGPTVPTSVREDDARAVLSRYDVAVSSSVDRALADPGNRPPDPDASAFDRSHTRVVANARTALSAASDVLADRGWPPTVVSSRVAGEAATVGRVVGGVARECEMHGTPFTPPVGMLSAGETTVAVDGTGTGGPNQEVVLGAALELDGAPAVIAAVDTDGIDGPTDAAGAIAAGEADWDRRAIEKALADNDAFGFLSERGATIETGPTGTNVNDLHVLLVD